MRHGLVGGRAVRFGKNDIDRDRRGLQFVQAGQPKDEEVPNNSGPSLYANNASTFALELSAEGATFFEEALQNSVAE